MSEQLGAALSQKLPNEVTLDREKAPELEFKLSAETIKEIEEIEANIRTAEQRSGLIILR